MAELFCRRKLIRLLHPLYSAPCVTTQLGISGIMDNTLRSHGHRSRYHFRADQHTSSGLLSTMIKDTVSAAQIVGDMSNLMPELLKLVIDMTEFDSRPTTSSALDYLFPGKAYEALHNLPRLPAFCHLIHVEWRGTDLPEPVACLPTLAYTSTKTALCQNWEAGMCSQITSLRIERST